MTDPEGPRLVTPAEFTEMTALLDRYFAYERGGMAARLPFAYDPDRCDRHAVFVADGRVVSHVAAVPQTLSVGPDTVECWGIGGVATDRRHRGNGYMSRLLSFWFEQMADRGVPLSDLSGNRQRYAHFGYELAGTEARYRLTERSFADDPTASAAVTVYDGGDAHLTTLRETSETEPYRVVRDRAASRAVFGQRGLETLLWDGDADPAYVGLTRESRSRTVAAFGGSAAGVDALLSHVLAVYDLRELTVRTPPWHPLEPVFARHSEGWTCRPHRKLRICDLPSLLDAFAGQLEARWTRSGRTETGSVTLGLADGESDESVRIEYGPERVSIERSGDEPAVERDRTDLTSLLFGMPERCGRLRESDPFLATALPLRFHVPPSEHV